MTAHLITKFFIVCEMLMCSVTLTKTDAPDNSVEMMDKEMMLAQMSLCLELLPYDIILYITRFLSTRECLPLRLTSSVFYDVCKTFLPVKFIYQTPIEPLSRVRAHWVT